MVLIAAHNSCLQTPNFLWGELAPGQTIKYLIAGVLCFSCSFCSAEPAGWHVIELHIVGELVTK